MKLILVRHGHASEKEDEIIQGHSQNGITKLGHEQANLVGQELKDQKLDVIYCSDLKRTKETLLPIIKHHPRVEVIYEPLLRERTSGIFDGKPMRLREEAMKKSGLSEEDFRPERGESLTDLNQRIYRFIRMLLETYTDETILIITHRRWISNFLIDIDRAIKDKIKRTKGIAHGCINVVNINNDGQREIELVDGRDHLEGLQSNMTSD